MQTIYDLLTEKEKKLVRIKKYHTDEILFMENERCLEIGIVLKGIISISSYSFKGVEMNYNTLIPSMIFGNNLIFSSDPFYKGNVISVNNSEVAFIKKNDLLNILQSNTNFLEKYLSIQSDFGKSLNNRIKILSFKDARDRFLYYLSSHHNKIKIRSITALALELNLTREVLSRLITKLINERIIIKNGKEITLIEN